MPGTLTVGTLCGLWRSGPTCRRRLPRVQVGGGGADSYPVRLNRCPACGAVCSDTAEWCTLCYADLRPRQPAIAVAPPGEVPAAGFCDPHLAPEPTADARSRTGSQPVAVVAPPDDVPAAGTGEQHRAPEPSADTRVLTAAEAVAAVASEPRWPCGACGELMPIAEPACTVCGAPFLGETAAPPLARFAAMSPGRRALVMVVGAVALMALFMLLALVVGSLL